MDLLFSDDFMRKSSPSLGGTVSIAPEIFSETESELMQALSLAGWGDSENASLLAGSEQELFSCLGLSGPFGDFFKGTGQFFYNIGRAVRNSVRAVVNKPPLPTYDLRTGKLMVATDADTKVAVSENGLLVNGVLVAPSTEIASAYDAGYADAFKKGELVPVDRPMVNLPIVGPVETKTVFIGAIAGAGILLLLLKK